MKKLKVVAYALNLSGVLLGLTYLLFKLRDKEYLKDWHVVLILSLVIFQFIYYAISRQNKS